MTNNVMPEGSESLVILPFFRDGSFTSPVTVKTRQEFCNPIAATQLLVGCHAYFFPTPPSHPWSGAIPAAKMVSSFLICWSLDTKNPRCSSGSHSLQCNRTRMLAAVSPDQQDSPLGTRTLNCYTQDWGNRNHKPLRWPFRRMTVEASPLPTFPSQPQIVFL